MLPMKKPSLPQEVSGCNINSRLGQEITKCHPNALEVNVASSHMIYFQGNNFLSASAQKIHFKNWEREKKKYIYMRSSLTAWALQSQGQLQVELSVFCRFAVSKLCRSGCAEALVHGAASP